MDKEDPAPPIQDDKPNAIPENCSVEDSSAILTETISEKPAENGIKPISKNQQKRLKRKQDWEAGREARKILRRERTKEKKQRKRMELAEADNGTEASTSLPNSAQTNPRQRQKAIQLPITFVFDCQYDDLMTDNERVSLSGQLTRSYSENRKAPFRAHLIISSFGGSLKARFDGILAGSYHSWHSVNVIEGDFTEAANQAQETMRSPQGGKIRGALAEQQANEQATNAADQPTGGEVIYLSSDSPNTITALKPYSTYIIGGLVDRNRHKGACYKKAMDAKVQTAKLPIGEFLQMQSRMVLTTNHVCQILLKWLELGDWGQAFMEVVPKRKGGMLKEAQPGTSPEPGNGDGEEGDSGEERGDAFQGGVGRESSPTVSTVHDESHPQSVSDA